MRSLTLTSVVLLAIAAASLAGAPAGQPATYNVELNGHTFTLPVGFEIEQVAGPPLVNRPIVADFDEQGRLYVADSSGSNDNVKVQLQQKPHRIVRLEDTDGDGRFDRATVFADHMMFPEGAQWYDGSLYVAAPPSIWKLTDTKGDGVADQRSEWFQGKTLTNCANDLHGPYVGLDGWIYWCKGAFAEQKYERPGKPPFVTRAAHIFRCRPDGSGIETVMTGGMDNPVEVVFTPGGERIFTTTFLQRPGGGRRDGLIHAIYGGIYGKENNAVDGHPRTSPGLMPVLVHLGPAAPAGLARYESRGFGAGYQDNLFAALFNLHKVTRHVLEPSGSTFAAHTEDFLASNQFDFHPTDVLEDADGSLLVLDTGGWYKLCCPSSQLHKPDILGAIYRVRRKGMAKVADARGLKLAWASLTPAELARLLDDPRPAVRRWAIKSLGEKGPVALSALLGAMRSDRSVESRRNAVWAATRIDWPGARAIVRTALRDSDETVRQAAAHSASVWRDRPAVPALLGLLKGASLHNRRVAAEALGRIGDKAAVALLLETVGSAADEILEHSLTYALIEIGDKSGLSTGLKSDNVRIRRAVLVALDQMAGSDLQPLTVAPYLGTSDARMRETAGWIAERHPEWGSALAGLLRERLQATELKPAEQEELVRQLARFARAPGVQAMLAERVGAGVSARTGCRVALLAMARSGLKLVPASWNLALATVLGSGDKELVAEAATTARALQLPKGQAEKLTVALLAIGTNEQTPIPVRLTALAAVPGGLAEVKAPLFDFLRSEVDHDKPVFDRTLAADVLARAHHDSEQLIALADCLKNCGPLEVKQLLDAFTKSTDDRIGQHLVAALTAPAVRAGLSVGMLRPRLAQFKSPVQHQAEELYALLDADSVKQKARLEQLLTTLKTGDVRRGQAVFNNPKVACSACHSVGYVGGKVGPDLTRIGNIRDERALLEAIVFPSASFVRSYEPMVVMTKAGRSFNGVIRQDVLSSSDEIVLCTGPNQNVRIAREEIEEIQPSKVSVMPAGLDQQLTAQELADLIAFLKARK